jgi:RNA polymerase sigma-70 factor (ECF subfamily)
VPERVSVGVLKRPANRRQRGGVLLSNTAMNGYAASLTVPAHLEQELEREFEARLAESATLAFRLAYSVLRHHEDAEDVAQDAFARAYRRFGQLRDRDRFRAWLARMTWRLALDRRRSDLRRQAREQIEFRDRVSVESARGSHGAHVEAEQRARALWHAIDALPEKLRIVIVLANMEEHGIADVARLLALPQGTVKSRLFDARQRLKDQLRWMNAKR